MFIRYFKANVECPSFLLILPSQWLYIEQLLSQNPLERDVYEEINVTGHKKTLFIYPVYTWNLADLTFERTFLGTLSMAASAKDRALSVGK